MFSKKPQEKPQSQELNSGRKARPFRTTMMTVVLLLVPAFLYFNTIVERHTEHNLDRRLRALDTIAEQAKFQFESAAGNLQQTYGEKTGDQGGACESEDGAFDVRLGKDNKTESPKYTICKDTLIAHFPGTAFDRVILADSEGKILASRAPQRPSSPVASSYVIPEPFRGLSGVKALLNQARVAEMTGSSDNNLTDSTKSARPKADGQLPTSPVVLDTEIGRKDYQVFVRPFQVPSNLNIRIHETQCDCQLMLLGFKDRASIASRVAALGPEKLIYVGLIALALILAWPLLRMQFLEAYDALTRAEVVSAIYASWGIGIIAVVAAATTLTQPHVRDTLDTEADRAAGQIVDHLTDQLRSVIRIMETWNPEQQPPETARSMVDVFFAANEDGVVTSLFALDTLEYERMETGAIKIDDRPYFRNVQTAATGWPTAPLFENAGEDPGDANIFFFERLINRHDGKRIGELSIRNPSFGNVNAPTMLAADMPFWGLQYPVLPQFLTFAVFDDATGTVLFHSDDNVALIQNLLEATDRAPLLVTATARRTTGEDSPVAFNLKYRGEDVRAVYRAIPGLPFSIAVMYDRDEVAIWSGFAVLATLTVALLIPVLLFGLQWVFQAISNAVDHSPKRRNKTNISLMTRALVGSGLLMMIVKPELFVAVALALVAWLLVIRSRYSKDSHGDTPEDIRRTIAIHAAICGLFSFSVMFVFDSVLRTNTEWALRLQAESILERLESREGWSPKNAVEANLGVERCSQESAALFCYEPGVPEASSISQAHVGLMGSWLESLLETRTAAEGGLGRYTFAEKRIADHRGHVYGRNGASQVLARPYPWGHTVRWSIPEDFDLWSNGPLRWIGTCALVGLLIAALYTFVIRHTLGRPVYALDLRSNDALLRKKGGLKLLIGPEWLEPLVRKNQTMQRALRRASGFLQDGDGDGRLATLEDRKAYLLTLEKQLACTTGETVYLRVGSSPLFRLLHAHQYPDSEDFQALKDWERVRWATIFARAQKLYLEDFLDDSTTRTPFGDRDEPGPYAEQLDHEIRNAWPILAGIESDLAEGIDSLENWQDVLSVHAEPRFRKLWEECTRAERLTLYHLANRRFPNPANSEVLKHLKRRGFIADGWRPVIGAETLRDFILHAEPLARFTEWERQASSGIWHSIRVPFLLLLAILLGWLIYTAGDTINVVSAILVGAVALLTHLSNIARIVGFGSWGAGGGGGGG